MRTASLCFLSTLSLLIPLTVAAQDSLVPGDRVRITSRGLDPRRQDGRLLSLTGGGDSVVVEVVRLRTIRYRDVLAPDTIAAPLGALERVEVSRGSGRRTLRGALIGGSITALLGYVMGSGFNQHCDDCTPAHSPEVQGLMGAGLFGAGGALIGALVGSTVRWDRWQDVHPVRGGMLFRPLPEGGSGVGLMLRF